MRGALTLARRGARAGEVPVGALVVVDGGIVGRAHNRPIGASDPTAHAEILAIREAAERIGNYRLTGAEMYVTLEPCLMCLGAALHARIGRVVYGAPDPRLGAAALVETLQAAPGALNHRLALEGGVEAAASARLLKTFFQARRRQIETDAAAPAGPRGARPAVRRIVPKKRGADASGSGARRRMAVSG